MYYICKFLYNFILRGLYEQTTINALIRTKHLNYMLWDFIDSFLYDTLSNLPFKPSRPSWVPFSLLIVRSNHSAMSSRRQIIWSMRHRSSLSFVIVVLSPGSRDTILVLGMPRARRRRPSPPYRPLKIHWDTEWVSECAGEVYATRLGDTRRPGVIISVLMRWLFFRHFVMIKWPNNEGPATHNHIPLKEIPLHQDSLRKTYFPILWHFRYQLNPTKITFSFQNYS